MVLYPAPKTATRATLAHSRRLGREWLRLHARRGGGRGNHGPTSPVTTIVQRFIRIRAGREPFDMRFHAVFFFWVLAGLLAAGTAAGAEGDPAQHLDRYLTGWVDMERFSGNVLLAKNGKVLFRKSYGMADIENDVPNKADTVFRIGSMTKSFTALAVLQLRERGRLALEDPLAKHLPETPAAWRAVTIHHLLTHSSGVPDISRAAPYSDYADPQRIEKALEAVKDKPLQFDPGNRFAYSNSGYMLLGRVIEKLSGMKYEDYLAANILQPAGMIHTGLDRNERILRHRAAGYVVRDGQLANAIQDEMMGPFSAGGLYSTVDDLLRFDQALSTGKLVKKETIEKAFTPHVKAAFPPPVNDPNAYYGYGFLVSSVEGHKSVGHGGWVNGFVTDFTRYPDDGMVLIILGNMEGPWMPIITQKTNKILWGASYEVPKRRVGVKISDAALQAVTGRYEVAPGMALVFTTQSGKLFVEQVGQPVKFEVKAESESRFFAVDLPTVLTFERDASGKVISVLLDMDGQKVQARRVE